MAIETALTLRLIFNLPLRQAESFLNSLFRMLCVSLEVPDHTTLSRRGQSLDIKLRRIPKGKTIHLIIDSTGLANVGEGEWAFAKHGGKGKRGWKKLHLGVDGSGVIVAQLLTDGNADDAKAGLDLIDAVEGDIASFTGDAAYDAIAIYEAAGTRGAKVVVPPMKTAVVSRRTPRSAPRDRTIRRGEEDEATTVEEGVRLPSPWHRRERLLQVQVDPRGQASCSASQGPASRSVDRLQHPERDD